MSVKRKKNIKFLTIYNAFTETEKNEFKKFVTYSPGNSRRNYSKILSSLRLSENGIIEYPEAGTGRTRWNRLSELNLLAEKFLTQKSIESCNFMKRLLLIREYQRRDMKLTFEHNYKKFMSEISNVPIVDYNYYHIAQLDKIFSEYNRSDQDKNSLMRFTQSGTIRTGVYIIELLEHLIKIWNLKAAGILNFKSLNEEIFESLNFEKILLTLSVNSKSPDKLYQIIKFLHLICLSLKNPENDEIYIKAKKIFFRDLKTLSDEKKSQYLDYMIEIMLERANLSIAGSMEELFDLMNKKLKTGFVKDMLSGNNAEYGFRDYIFASISLGKYRWAIRFINKYGPLLPEDIREDHILLGKALVLFHEKKLSACYDYLSKIRKKNPFFFVDVSVLKLKVLYELKMFDESLEELKRFNEYLRRERIIQDHLRVYAREFCNAFSLLVKLRQNPNRNNLNELEFLLSGKNLIGKKWIINKMNEIMK